MKLIDINITGNDINYKGYIMINYKGIFNGILEDTENIKSFIKGQIYQDFEGFKIRATQIVDIDKKITDNDDLMYDLIYFAKNKCFYGNVLNKGQYEKITMSFKKVKENVRNKINALKDEIKALQNEIKINHNYKRGI